MITLLVLGVLFFAAMLVIGVLAAVAGFVGFVITLPFRLLGWTLKLVGMLIALPFLLVGGAVALLFGLLPFAPIVALAWLAWWLLHDRNKPERSQASVVS